MQIAPFGVIFIRCDSIKRPFDLRHNTLVICRISAIWLSVYPTPLASLISPMSPCWLLPAKASKSAHTPRTSGFSSRSVPDIHSLQWSFIQFLLVIVDLPFSFVTFLQQQAHQPLKRWTRFFRIVPASNQFNNLAISLVLTCIVLNRLSFHSIVPK